MLFRLQAMKPGPNLGFFAKISKFFFAARGPILFPPPAPNIEGGVSRQPDQPWARQIQETPMLYLLHKGFYGLSLTRHLSY